MQLIRSLCEYDGYPASVSSNYAWFLFLALSLFLIPCVGGVDVVSFVCFGLFYVC